MRFDSAQSVKALVLAEARICVSKEAQSVNPSQTNTCSITTEYIKFGLKVIPIQEKKELSDRLHVYYENSYITTRDVVAAQIVLNTRCAASASLSRPVWGRKHPRP
jgi:hypothetical protein